MTSRPENEGQFVSDWVRAQRTVSAYIAAAIPDFHAAEDVLQAVATKAYAMRERFDPASSKFSTWVIGIARNEIRTWNRSAMRDRHVFGDDIIDALTQAAERVDSQVRDLQEALAECLKGVSGRGKEVLDMRYEQNLRSRQIAERLDTSESVVNVTLHRVRVLLLRCILEKTGIEEVGP